MTEASDEATAFLALTDKILRDRGFGAERYKDTCLKRRIAVRMRARNTGSYRDYSRLLDQDPSEYDRLLDVLTINVTRLFRNPDTWQAVAATVLPALWALPTPRLTCWVAGCASGEEAYTLAALWERFLGERGEEERRTRIRVLASDIDRASLDAARRGSYPPEAFTDTPLDMRARYFTRGPEEGRESASPALRTLVQFEPRDILMQEAPRPVHLITCRNVIIYFERSAQEDLMRRFHAALVPGGFLVLGKVETLLGPARELFDVVDQRQRIFRRR